ncbi:cation:proton antiporter [Candidatus Peregrinibacteria bacterium]|nr:MAG: cation:proton antiporter [Candidatus Peregrinibacteria bacterium]
MGSAFFGQTIEASLFIAMGLSISAIALAARLFKDCGIQNTKVAHLTLGAAVIDDILALVIFSLVLNLAETGSIELATLLFLLVKVVLFFTLVIIGGTKSAKHLNRLIYFGNKGFTVTLIIALMMGLIAEAIGLHMIMGAFMAGLFIKEEVLDQRVFEKIEDRIYGLAYGFFGPIFFASLAFSLDFTAIKTAPWFLVSIIAVAIAGKVIGAGGTARMIGFKSIESWVIGLAMNNRGAVELIIASIGLEKGIIDETVFSILVLMAFGTTLFSVVSTPPLAKRMKALN